MRYKMYDKRDQNVLEQANMEARLDRFFRAYAKPMHKILVQQARYMSKLEVEYLPDDRVFQAKLIYRLADEKTQIVHVGHGNSFLEALAALIVGTNHTHPSAFADGPGLAIVDDDFDIEEFNDRPF